MQLQINLNGEFGGSEIERVIFQCVLESGDDNRKKTRSLKIYIHKFLKF